MAVAPDAAPDLTRAPSAAGAVNPGVIILAPFGLRTAAALRIVLAAVDCDARNLLVVVPASRSGRAAVAAGAAVVVMPLRPSLASARQGATAFRQLRCLTGGGARVLLWSDGEWIGPYRSIVNACVRALGGGAVHEVTTAGNIIRWDEQNPLTGGTRALVGNLVTAVQARGVAAATRSLRVPTRSRTPIGRALYLRNDIGFTVSDRPGGSLSHSRGVIAGLQDNGITVTTVAPHPLSAARRTPPNRVSCHFSLRSDLHPELVEVASDRALRFQLERSDLGHPDFVYQRHTLYGLAGLALAHRLQIPLVLEVNASEVRFRQQYDRILFRRWGAAFESELFAAASLVVTVSEAVADDVRDMAPSSRLAVIPNAVDPESFAVSPERRVTTRNQLEVAETEILVGFFGRFYPWHGVEVLADAALAFLPADQRIRLLLVGDGDGRHAVDARLEHLGRRIIATGIVPHEEIPSLMSACDILVSPHTPAERFVGSPMKVFEYMAAGRAIIASRLDQIGETLHDGQTAVLTQPGNVDELASCVLALAQDAPLRARLGNAARADAVQSHSWTDRMRRVLALIEPA